MTPCSTRLSSNSLSAFWRSSSYPSLVSTLPTTLKMAALKASPELFKRRISLFGPGVALFLLLLAFPHANLLAANIATSTPDDSSVFQLETDGAPSSFNGGSDGNYQTLGNGLSGTLRGVELAYGADTTYYAVNMAVMVDECSTALYDHCSTIASSPRLGGSWDGRREFDMPSYDLKPCKYYRIVISVNGSFGSLGQVFVYGSANDDYSYGAFTTHSPFDLFFIVHGASRIPPAPFCPAPVVIIPGVLGSW